MTTNPILNPFQLLELNVISGQDLAAVSCKMRTYAVAWIHPDRKLSTRVDLQNDNNPSWNDKFVFRVDNEFLYGDTSAVMIEVYAVHWFRDIHVGTVRVLISNLIPPTIFPHNPHVNLGMRFVALQVRRRSGRPQGILNIGVAVLNSSMRSMPLYSNLSSSAVGYRKLMGEDNPRTSQSKDDDKSSKNNQLLLLPWIPKPDLRRTKSDSSSLIAPMMAAQRRSKADSTVRRSEVAKTKKRRKNNKKKRKGGSLVGSVVSRSDLKPSSLINGSEIVALPMGYESVVSDHPSPETKPQRSPLKELELEIRKRGKIPPVTESDVGPSASEVAAIMVKKNNLESSDSESTLGEWSLEDSMDGLRSKLELWRRELPPAYDRDRDEFSSFLNGSPHGEKKRGLARRRSDGGGLFSCFGTICGVECSVVCCGSSTRRKGGRIKRSASMDL